MTKKFISSRELSRHYSSLKKELFQKQLQQAVDEYENNGGYTLEEVKKE